MPGMYAVISMPEVRRTRATLRRAEFGFLGVVVYTRVQTPRRCGDPFRAGDFDFSFFDCRPCRTNCWMVGTDSPSRVQPAARPGLVAPGAPHLYAAHVGFISANPRDRGRAYQRMSSRCSRSAINPTPEVPGATGPTEAHRTRARNSHRGVVPEGDAANRAQLVQARRGRISPPWQSVKPSFGPKLSKPPATITMRAKGKPVIGSV